MIIEKIKVINYKIFREKTIELNDNINIFVGENDAGKSTILEIINLITNGKINGYNIDRQITTNVFNFYVRKKYINKVQNEYIVKPSFDRRLLSICIKDETNSTLYKCATLNVKPL